MQDERPAWAPPRWLGERLRAALPDGWELVEVRAPVSGRGDGGGVSPEAVHAIRGAEVFFGMGLPRELLLSALETPGSLRWVHTGAAGVASLLHPELRSHAIVLTNSAGIHGAPMAETALAMILHFARGLDYAAAAAHRAEWHTAPFERTDSGIGEIAGATAGIVGYGGIGREIAWRAAALGMTVIATRRTAGPVPGSRAHSPSGPEAGDGSGSRGGVAVLRGEGALQALLRRSDFVILTVPATRETRGLIGAGELALMKPGAVLVNLARGSIVDEAALVEALRARKIRGAGLDVFAKEPLPPESPLWQMDNVLVTPHVSATTPRYWDRQAELMLDNLGRYFRGEPLRNQVDPDAGY